MRRSHLSRLAAPGLALLLFAAACSDSTAPDLGSIGTDLQRVEQTFESPVYASFSGLSQFMVPGGGPLPSALMRAAAPEALLERDQPRQLVAAENLRAMIPHLSGPLAGPIIHDTLYTRVYVWDAAAGYYVRDPAQTGPATGVRFILYAVDLGGVPITPLAPIGSVDLIDESAGPTVQLHVLVRNTAATATYVDYTAMVTPATGSFTAAVNGFVSNGQQGTSLRRLNFNIAFSASETPTTADIAADATFDLASSSISLEVHDDGHFEGSTWTFARDFRFEQATHTVTVVGSVMVTETSPDVFTINGEVTVRVDGAVFVIVTLTNGQVTTSRELSNAEQVMLLRLLNAVEGVWDAIEDFFDPLDHAVS
jgi:hypothetical protein